MARSLVWWQIFKHTRVLTVTVTLLLIAFGGASMKAEVKSSFVVGVNYPWIAYGHDFGGNLWGHDGLITGGWTYQTYVDSQGLIDARYTKSKAHSGVGSLNLTADLVGHDPEKAKGEVYIDLRSHTPPGVSVPIDVTHATVSCWLFLPDGSAGDPNAPNGVQFIFKSEGFYSLYTPYQNIQRGQEGHWVQFTADASTADYRDAQYDPAKGIAVGLKISINDHSDATLAGEIFLDDYVISTPPPIAFDFERLEVETDFGTLQQALGECSAPVVRVFVFADGRASPEFSFDDEVTGLDEYFFQDLDALLEAAKQQNLKVIPVLLDFSWFDLAKFENGVQLGGRSGIIRNSIRRQAFLDKALKPLVQRYCDNSQILAWEVINEPEWATKELSTGFQTSDPVALAEMQEFVRLCAETIHSCTGQRVTVGSARRMWLQYWSGLGLDLYQFHWYEHFSQEEPFPWHPYSQLGLDKPALVGEVPTATGLYSTRDYLLAAASAGYEGLLVWSYRAPDEFSGYANAREMLEGWCGASPRRRAVRSSIEESDHP